jgi:hypothetical protein
MIAAALRQVQRDTAPLGNMANMDLTKDIPRSPNDMLAGIVSLPRMIDKTQADAAGTLGEYDVDCPHDKPVLAFLGIDYPAFKSKLEELGFDTAKVGAWAEPLVKKHSPEEIAAFNESRRNWKPDTRSSTSTSSKPKSRRTGPM